MKASWNGRVIAESNDTIVVEGNHYFPAESVDSQYLTQSDTTSTCPWKGTASYCNVVVDGDANADAAWFYPAPKEAARQIAGHYAFWNGVVVG